MKKLALVLAVLMLAVACVVPAAAADPETKTISFGVRSEEEEAYIDASDNADDITSSENFDQRLATNEAVAVYKFNIGKGVTSASAVIPVCYKFVVYASVDGENYTQVYDWETYKAACGKDDTDMLYYKEWGPVTEKIDLTSVVKADAETLYIKIVGISAEEYAVLYCPEEARSVALRYYNAQLNRLDQKKDDGSDWGDTDEHDEFTFDGKFTLTYTVAGTEEGGESTDTDPIAPPQTADFTAAFVAVAVVALGATVVVAKKKH